MEKNILPINIKNFDLLKNNPEIFFKNYERIETNAFKNLSSKEIEQLKELVIPGNVKLVSRNAFTGCYALEKLEFQEGLKIVGTTAFEDCVELKEVVFPKSLYHFDFDVFSKCKNLKRIAIKNKNAELDTAFARKFKYAFLNKEDHLIFSNVVPEQSEDIVSIIDFENIRENIMEDDFSFNNFEELKYLDFFANLAKKNKFKISSGFVLCLVREKYVDIFLKNATFKYFSAEVNSAGNLIKDATYIPNLYFFKLAYSLGCFSNEYIKDKEGNNTKVLVAQKASSVLIRIIKKYIPYQNLCIFFNDMPFIEPNQEFLKFISVTDKDDYPNVQMLLNLSNNLKNIFYFTMMEFDNIKNLRRSLSSDGLPVNISWEDAIMKHYFKNEFMGINDSNRDIAKLFQKRGLSQKDFDLASSLRNQAIKSNVPHDIIPVHINEKDIIKRIEEQKKLTSNLLEQIYSKLTSLSKTIYTYEFLDKYDPINAIIGLYCDCCATITSVLYGSNIAKATMISDDVQNIVVYDANNHIAAKCTLYVNKDLGYGVINDFKVRNDIEANRNEKIFKTFMRAIHKFVEEYDKIYPNKPIQQINVGMGYNDLEDQLEDIKLEEKNLQVPFKYGFKDAAYQKAIYVKKSSHKKDKTK